MNSTEWPIPPQRILVPVDFSRASVAGLRYAGVLADKFGGKLDLLYVVEPPSYPDWGYAHLVLRDAKLRKAAGEKLPRFARDCGIASDLVAATEVLAGEADWEIVKAARSRKSDLIVIATHGFTALKRSIIGSTAERVVRQAPCPVWSVREPLLRRKPPAAPTLRLKRILLPTDFSAASKTAFPYATAMARRFEAALVLVYVVPSMVPAEFSQIGMVIKERQLLAETRRRLPRFRDDELEASLEVETCVVAGSPAYEITRAATKLRCDLIIMATHGHTGLRRFLLGSVTEKVLRYAPVPVLVTRERQREVLSGQRR